MEREKYTFFGKNTKKEKRGKTQVVKKVLI